MEVIKISPLSLKPLPYLLPLIVTNKTALGIAKGHKERTQ